MKIAQFPYLSLEARKLRARDGTPPWGVHPCEVDAVASSITERETGPFVDSFHEAARLRAELESA